MGDCRQFLLRVIVHISFAESTVHVSGRITSWPVQERSGAPFKGSLHGLSRNAQEYHLKDHFMARAGTLRSTI
eukprot:1156864-Pelagomonas_calceolata.AAC.7